MWDSILFLASFPCTLVIPAFTCSLKHCATKCLQCHAPLCVWHEGQHHYNNNNNNNHCSKKTGNTSLTSNHTHFLFHSCRYEYSHQTWTTIRKSDLISEHKRLLAQDPEWMDTPTCTFVDRAIIEGEVWGEGGREWSPACSHSHPS